VSHLFYISCNIYNSHEFVTKGVEHVKEADSIHKSSVGWQQKITLGLGVVATALVAGVVAKFTGI
jgi:hypothetical protein